MPILHAIVLGLVQGLSEFLPISSSGHLLLVPWLFGWDDFDSDSVEKAFDVALHIGTLVAVIAYFRHDLVVYVREGLRAVFRRDRPVTTEGRIAWLLVLSTIPAAAVGAVFESQIDEGLGTPTIIAVSLILGGLLLAWADRATGTRKVEDYSRQGRPDRRRGPGPRPQPGHVPLGHHHHRGALPPLRSRRRCPRQLPDDDPGHRRRGRVQDGRARRRRDPRRAPRADGRRHRDIGDRRVVGGVGHVDAGAHAQLHAVRDLPGRRSAWPCS